MKSSKTSFVAGLAGALTLAAGMLLPSQHALAQWQPERPIEFVIQTSPGGGSDIYTRLWLGIIEKQNLSPVPLTPVNMPGGAGAVALTYLHSQKGDPHYLTITLNSVVTTPLQVKIPVMYTSRDLTPVALMTIDPFLLWVNPSKYKDWAAFEAACEERRLTSAGTGARQEDEIQISVFQEATDCQKFRYVPKSGGGEVAKDVAGGHVDFSVNQPSEGRPHYPERMHPIIAFANERLEAWPDVPTHVELGIGNAEQQKRLALETGLHQHRGVIGPPDMPAEAKEWYHNMFKKVFAAKEWQDFVEKNGMVPAFKGPDEYQAWLEPFEQNHIRIMRDVNGWPLRADLEPR